MKVKAISVRCVELFKQDGTPLGLFKVDSEWNGMRKLVRIPIHDSEYVQPSVIIDTDCATPVTKMFDDVFGEHRGEFEVMKLSPELAAELMGKRS